MKVAAIVAEFNPFHNGHAWLIEQAKKARSADYVVIIMSGNFVQRGEPAVADKFLRTKMALLCGADLVLELPTPFATASAREFARAAVALSDQTGIVDELVFGVEGLPDSIKKTAEPAELLDALSQTADVLLIEEPLFQQQLKALLRGGMNYPRAREAALHAFTDFSESTEASKTACPKHVKSVCASEAAPEHRTEIGPHAALLSSPNNVLALEYLQALKLRTSAIRPVPVLRQGDGYHSEATSGSPFASATALRSMLLSSKDVSPYVPPALSSFYQFERAADKADTPDEANTAASDIALSDTGVLDAVPSNSGLTDFSRPHWLSTSALDVPLQHCLLAHLRAGTDFSRFADVSAEIAGRLRRSAGRICSFDQRVEQLWTKQYTRSRISRALLHVLLGITKEQTEAQKQRGYHDFIRILGFSNAARAELLPALKQHAALPVITRAAAHKEMLADEIYYSDFYYALQAGNSRNSQPAVMAGSVKNELQRRIEIV